MKRSQAVPEEGANLGRIPAPNIQEGSKVSLDARHIRTTGPTWKLDWRRLGQFTVVRCKDAYTSVRPHRDMAGNVDSSDYICRHVDVKVRLSLKI